MSLSIFTHLLVLKTAADINLLSLSRSSMHQIPGMVQIQSSALPCVLQPIPKIRTLLHECGYAPDAAETILGKAGFLSRGQSSVASSSALHSSVSATPSASATSQRSAAGRRAEAAAAGVLASKHRTREELEQVRTIFARIFSLLIKTILAIIEL